MAPFLFCADAILLPRTTTSRRNRVGRRLTVETLRAQILTLSKNDDRDGNAGAAEKSAADACCHFDSSASVGRLVSAAAGQGRAPVGSEPVAHPVRPEGRRPDRGSAAALPLMSAARPALVSLDGAVAARGVRADRPAAQPRRRRPVGRTALHRACAAAEDADRRVRRPGVSRGADIAARLDAAAPHPARADRRLGSGPRPAGRARQSDHSLRHRARIATCSAKFLPACRSSSPIRWWRTPSFIAAARRIIRSAARICSSSSARASPAPGWMIRSRTMPCAGRTRPHGVRRGRPALPLRSSRLRRGLYVASGTGRASWRRRSRNCCDSAANG